MTVTLTCSGCGAVDEQVRNHIPDSFRCKQCGELTILVHPPKKRAQKERAKKPAFSPGWRFMADVVSHPERGLVLACWRPPAFKKFSVEPGSKWRASDLAGMKVSLEVVQQRRDGSLVVRVVQPPAQHQRRMAKITIPAWRLARDQDLELAFPAIGDSELEQLAMNGGAVIDRIDQLAAKKDDPAAWWTLALGHRSQRIRRPVEQALKDVGIEKVDRMLRQNYQFDWDNELLDFIGEEMRKPRPRGGGGVTLAGDRSGWDKPWWADD